MREALEKIEQAAKEQLEMVSEAKALEELRVKFLGKKGELTAILKQMGKLSPEERPVIGQLANKVRSDIEQAIAQRLESINNAEKEKRLKEETLDVTLPGKKIKIGKPHPLNKVLNEVEEVFIGMGF